MYLSGPAARGGPCGLPTVLQRRAVIPRSIQCAVAAAPRTASIDPKTYMPDSKYSTEAIKECLSHSDLGQMSNAEAMCRIELAAAYRVFALKGWNDNVIVSAPMLAPIFNHLTVKIPSEGGASDEKEAFLINPFGLRYDEITASSLLTITEDGDVINPGVVGDIFGVNKAGFIIHSALHRARPDVRSVMHSHYAPAAGVSAQRDGLKELAQTIHLLGPIAYHDYEGIVVDPAEEERLVADVGESNTVFLRNHDVNTLGNSVGAALIQMDQLMLACELQTAAEAAGTDNLLTPPIDTIEKTYEVTRTFTGSAGFGIMEFCAMMRHLDKLDDSYRL